MNKQIIRCAAVFGVLAVILGAFGAHSLKEIVSVSELSIWQKGVEYQFYHTFALLFLATLATNGRKFIKPAFIFFSLGILLFSGSLYLLALKNQLSFSVSFIGPVTPIGGLCFILGWVCLFLSVYKDK